MAAVVQHIPGTGMGTEPSIALLGVKGCGTWFFFSHLPKGISFLMGWDYPGPWVSSLCLSVGVFPSCCCEDYTLS